MSLLCGVRVFQYIPCLNQCVSKPCFRRLNRHSGQGDTHLTRGGHNRGRGYRPVALSESLPRCQPHRVREYCGNLCGVARGGISQRLVNIVAVLRLKRLAQFRLAVVVQFFKMCLVLRVDDPDSLPLFHNQIRHET